MGALVDQVRRRPSPHLAGLKSIKPTAEPEGTPGVLGRRRMLFPVDRSTETICAFFSFPVARPPSPPGLSFLAKGLRSSGRERLRLVQIEPSR